MRTSLSMRATAALTLFFSLGLEAALAHAHASFRSPVTRPGIAYGHSQAPGWRNVRHSSWTWRGQNGQNRWSRNSWWLLNQGGFYGSGFWYSPYGFANTTSGGGGPLVVVGAPALNLYSAVATGGFESESERGCVIHKLLYDRAGKYLGERQTSEC